MNLDLIKKIYTYRFEIRGLFNPFIGLKVSSFGDYLGVNDLKREVPLIVSLSSCRENFEELPKTLYSLLTQSIKPDRIILWLDESSEDLAYLPYEITQFVKNGLEIRFVKDKGVYTKALYVLKEFSEAVVVLADDEIYYPKDWLKKLYLSYISNPKDIQVHKAIRFNKDLPIKKWNRNIEEENARFDNFLISSAGVLLPPKCFSSEFFREDICLKKAYISLDIWIWVMSVINNRKIRIVKNHNKTVVAVNIFKYLSSKDFVNFDSELKNVLKFYKQNIYTKI